MKLKYERNAFQNKKNDFINQQSTQYTEPVLIKVVPIMRRNEITKINGERCMIGDIDIFAENEVMWP